MSSANVDALDAEHNTPLHYASQNGHVDVVNLLLCKNPNDRPIFRNAHCHTSLHPVAKHGHAVTSDNLIFNGANINACNKFKMTALHLACQNGHTSIVEILLNNHATVDVMKQSEETPFYLAAKNGHADVTDLLLSRGVSDFVLTGCNKETLLHAAVENGHKEVVEVILKHCARISVNLINRQHRLQENAFDLMIETSGVQPIQLLRSDGRRLSAGIVWSEEDKPLEIREDKYGHIALDIAVKSAQPKMVKLLLNADQGTYSEKHLRKSFHYLILSRVSDCRTDNEIATDLSDVEKYKIFSENIKEIAQTLISSSKFNVNYKNTFGQTTIYDVITEMRCFRNMPSKNIHMTYFIQLLLEKGADFNLKNSKGETPLMIASKYGCCDAIQILFDWEKQSGTKLDLDARDQYGETALMKAVANEECFHDIAVSVIACKTQD